MYYGSLHVRSDEDWRVKMQAHKGADAIHWVELPFNGGTIDIHAGRTQFLRLASIIVASLAPWCDSDFLRPEPIPKLNPFGEEYHVE